MPSEELAGPPEGLAGAFQKLAGASQGLAEASQELAGASHGLARASKRLARTSLGLAEASHGMTGDGKDESRHFCEDADMMFFSPRPYTFFIL